MMKAAIACDDPVVYLEHKNIWMLEGEVDTCAPAEIGKAQVRQQGDDVTIVSWSDTANVAQEAAKTLAQWRATLCEAFQSPELKAGWLQQVWSAGKSTSTPRCSRTSTVARAA